MRYLVIFEDEAHVCKAGVTTAMNGLPTPCWADIRSGAVVWMPGDDKDREPELVMSIDDILEMAGKQS